MEHLTLISSPFTSSAVTTVLGLHECKELDFSGLHRQTEHTSNLRGQGGGQDASFRCGVMQNEDQSSGIRDQCFSVI